MLKLIINDFNLVRVGYSIPNGFTLDFLHISTSGLFTTDSALFGIYYGPKSFFFVYILFMQFNVFEESEDYKFNE